MTIIQEIHAWSRGLLNWQQDAIARLYQDRTLSAADLDDLYALAKAEAGIPDPNGRQPQKLGNAQIAPLIDRARVVQLAAVKNIVNVNALANGSNLPIALTGMTVIYGENGAGKSGYSRVFKHACRARDRRELILPNANLDPNNAGVAQAVFEVVIDGVPTDLPWQYGLAADESLSDISILDTHCARAYIDNHGDFAYAPYGLDILEGLAGACNKLKLRATQEKTANTPSDAAYAALAKEQTAVATALLGIPSKTRHEHIEVLATLSQAEQDRLVLLTQTLTEADPKKKAQALRQKATRLSGLKGRLAAAISLICDEKVDQLRELIHKSKTAKAAAELAAAEFKKTPGQLAGTGGEDWKALFEAARAFAKVCHPDHEFPRVPEDAECPLCQNRLGEQGAARLVQFDTFIKQAAERAAKEARDTAATAFRAVQSAALDLMFRDGLVEELTDIDPMLAAECASMQECLHARRNLILRAAAAELQWEKVLALPADPRPSLAGHY